ncbi:somatostatin receptor type 4-like [Liolophura sinensis]|uniref:somatostatin receptor type 4-like n=1 Tax=Liolophura sinensis TaxID=3198878 RepID=UPI00315859B9
MDVLGTSESATLGDRCLSIVHEEEVDHLVITEETELLDECLLSGNFSSIETIESDSTLDQTNHTSHRTNVSDEFTRNENSFPPWKRTFDRIQYFIIGVYFPIVAILAIIGNVLVLLVLRKDVLQSTTSVYLIGLAVADVIFVINYSPKTLTAFESVVASRAYKTFRAFQISYFFPLVSLCHTAAVWVTISFTTERYIAVGWPLKAQKYCTKFRAKLAVIGAYIFAIALNGIRFFRRHVFEKVDPVSGDKYFAYTFTDLGHDKMLSAIIFWSYLLLAEALPFIILIGLNSAIIWHVWLAQKNRLKMAESNNANVEEGKSREKQITRILVSIVIAFLLCNAIAGTGSIWVALNGANSIYTTRDAGVYYVFLFGPALYITNPLVNCILYAACSSAMREGIRSQLCSNCCFRKNTRDRVKVKTHLTDASQQIGPI